MSEFEYLRVLVQPNSGCDKKGVAAGCYIGEEFVTATNDCKHDGQICPRLEMASGEGYDLCQSTHAEIRLIEKLRERYRDLDLIPEKVWIYGHYYSCENCANELRKFGIRELRIREY